jgi:hypothetical protein
MTFYDFNFTRFGCVSEFRLVPILWLAQLGVHVRFKVNSGTLERVHEITIQTITYKGRHTLSVKLSDFTVWRHTWRKNWVSCTVLKGNSAGLRTVLSSRHSHREMRSSLREYHSFLSLPADTTMTSSQGTSVSNKFIQQMNIAWYIPFQIPLLTPYFTLSFRVTLWPMWLANSKRQPSFYPP